MTDAERSTQESAPQRFYSPAELAPKIRRVFDGLGGILCVGVMVSLSMPEEPAFAVVMSVGSTYGEWQAAQRRVRSFARLFGVRTICMMGGPALWMHVLYGREGDEWTGWKQRMNALARSVDTNGVEAF